MSSYLKYAFFVRTNLNQNINSSSMITETGVSWLILRAAQQLGTGKENLALFLAGSKSKKIIERGWHLQQGYGALLWESIERIRDYIGQLTVMKFLVSEETVLGHYSFPLLKITAGGHNVMTEKIPIPLQKRNLKELITISNSEQETCALIKAGKTVQEIAAIRQFALTTVYHQLNRLISVGKLRAAEVISSATLAAVVQAKKSMPDATLPQLKEMLPQEISSDEIRCVLADEGHNTLIS